LCVEGTDGTIVISILGGTHGYAVCCMSVECKKVDISHPGLYRVGLTRGHRTATRLDSTQKGVGVGFIFCPRPTRTPESSYPLIASIAESVVYAVVSRLRAVAL